MTEKNSLPFTFHEKLDMYKYNVSDVRTELSASWSGLMGTKEPPGWTICKCSTLGWLLLESQFKSKPGPFNNHRKIWNLLRVQYYISASMSRFKLQQRSTVFPVLATVYVQGVPKKMSFSRKIAITTLKLIQKANVGGVLENSGYLLPNEHWDFQNWWKNDWENEA